MPFLRAREYLEKVEQKETVAVEDALFVISGLCEDLSMVDLPVEDSQKLFEYLKQWVRVIKILVQQNKEDFVQKKSYTRLEKLCHYLEEWENEMAASEPEGEENPFDIQACLSEKESNEEKFVTCIQMQDKIQEHFEQMQVMETDLVQEKKKLALEMLQIQ